MCKTSILYQLEHGGLNPEWLMLNLLAHMSEAQARSFCEQHDLHVTPEPTRTVEQAIADLYERKLDEVDAWMEEV